MDDNCSKGLWKNEELPYLRPPMINPDEENGVPPPESTSKSKLSAEAKEWYPSGYFQSLGETNNQRTNKSVQNRLVRPVIYNQNSTQQQICNDVNEIELEHLREVLVLLTSNPGKFDDAVPALLDNLNPYLNNQQMMERAVKCIVTQAVAEYNFWYTGARLCTLLDGHSHFFRFLLLHHCNELDFDHTNREKFRNFTMFLAESFSQLDWDHLFGSCLMKALDGLLNNAQPEDIKCVCQALKLTGLYLERANSSGLDDIIQRLESHMPRLSSSYAALLRSVLNLRASQWGRNFQQPSVEPIVNNIAEPIINNVRWSDGGPVFYGPDGIEISPEENAFLTENLAADNHTIDDSVQEDDPDSLWDPDPEMDEEIKAAFKLFIRMNKH